MSDDQPQRRDPAGGGGQPDDTRPFSPFEDDDDATRLSPRSGDADATRVSPVQPDGDPRSGDAWVFDRTDPQPRVDDPTAVIRPPQRDATSIMPPVDDDAWGAAEAPWSGRAEVRPPRPGDYTTTDWATEPAPEPRGRWWMPILVGILALLLLAALGWGIWLIVQARGDGATPAPTPTAPAATTPAETTEPTTQPTTEAPSTTNPTTAAPTTAEVTIPALRGLSQDDARQALSRRGLSSRLRFVHSSDAPPGTVIDSDPAEGQRVPPDTVVTLVIAAQPTPSPTATGAADQPDED